MDRWNNRRKSTCASRCSTGRSRSSRHPEVSETPYRTLFQLCCIPNICASPSWSRPPSSLEYISHLQDGKAWRSTSPCTTKACTDRLRIRGRPGLSMGGSDLYHDQRGIGELLPIVAGGRFRKASVHGSGRQQKRKPPGGRGLSL